MDFPRVKKTGNTAVSLPLEIIGSWKIGTSPWVYEFRSGGRYYVHDLTVPYQLLDSGMTLDHSGTRYTRRFGDPSGLPGVWVLESDSSEEWNLRSDGTYTYHWPGYEYFGDYTYDANTVDSMEMRAVITESGGTLIFDPPYQLSVAGSWSITGPSLTIVFPSGSVVYTRV